MGACRFLAVVMFGVSLVGACRFLEVVMFGVSLVGEGGEEVLGVPGVEASFFPFLSPSLCTAQCSSWGVVGGREHWLMYCTRLGSGMFRPKRDSKELRER